MSYDQWKTASPFDDEPDILEEIARAKQILKATDGSPLHNLDRLRIIDILKATEEFIEENV